MDKLLNPKTLKVADIKPYAANARQHPPSQIESLANGIKEFGFTIPVLVDSKNVLIAGHGRIEAAKSIGMKTVPALIADGWPQHEVDAYRLADNKLSDMGSWNSDALREELEALKKLGVDISTLAFDEADLLKLKATDQSKKELPEKLKPKTTKGTFWELGEHRLLIANPADTATVTTAMEVIPNLMVTAPTKIDEMNWVAFAGGIAYIWCEPMQCGEAIRAIGAGGLYFRSQVVWVHDNPIASDARYKVRHSFGYLCTRKNAQLNWRGERKQTTIWKPWFDEAQVVAPQHVRRVAITNHTERGDWVYDPEGADGETLRAAEAEQRRAFIVVKTREQAEALVNGWDKDE